MSRGFYAATDAMMSEMERFDTVANNLANINTHGFKRRQTIHHDFEHGFLERIQTSKMQLRTDAQGNQVKDLVQDLPAKIGVLGTGTYVSSSWTHYDEGALEETQNPLDLALKGDGFFTIQGPNGSERYTRDGHFQLNADGHLVTGQGNLVLGESGPIEIEPGARLTIESDGRVMSGNQEIDRLKLTNFKMPQMLSNEGGNSYSQSPGMETIEPTATVAQGFLEQSNVDVAGEMVQMISALRSYQIAQKALQSEDDMSSKLINQVGRG